MTVDAVVDERRQSSSSFISSRRIRVITGVGTSGVIQSSLTEMKVPSGSRLFDKGNHHGVQSAERDVEERSLIVKAALEHDSVEVGIAPQHVAVGLVGDNHPGHQRPACRFRVELGYKCENEPRHGGEQPAIIPQERAQRFRHRENELAVRPVKKHLIGEMFREQTCTLLTARRAQVEPLAAERSEGSLQNATGVLPAVWVCTPDSGHALKIVPTTAEATSHVLDPFRAESAVFPCVSILVLLAELVEMTSKDLMESVPPARNIPRARKLTDGGWDCHYIQYGGVVVADSLPARSSPRRAARAGRVLCKLNRVPPMVVRH